MADKSEDALQRARAAKGVAEQVFSKLLGEVAIGITRIGGAYALKINVTEAPADTLKLPNSVEGVPVQVEVTGKIRKRMVGPKNG
ncbi:MAG: hypothetical protein WKF77_08535 [Planctomycetaceae bacterium]